MKMSHSTLVPLWMSQKRAEDMHTSVHILWARGRVCEDALSGEAVSMLGAESLSCLLCLPAVQSCTVVRGELI